MIHKNSIFFKEHQLEEGKEYWICVVCLNGKYTGFKRCVKPFKTKLLKIVKNKDKYFSWHNFVFDKETNTKYFNTMYSTHNIFYYGVI